MSVACAQNLAKFANQEEGMPNSALIKVYTRCISLSLICYLTTYIICGQHNLIAWMG